MNNKVDVILGPDVGKVWITIRQGKKTETFEMKHTASGLLGMADGFMRAARMTLEADGD